MKCSKCNYTSFDFHNFCPKCNTDLTNLKKILNIIDFEINDHNNYLIESKPSDDIPTEPDKNYQEKDIEEAPATSDKLDEETTVVESITVPSSDSEKSDTNDDNTISLDNILDNNKTDTISGEDHNKPSPKINGLETGKVDDDEISLDDIDLGDLLETNREE